MLINSCVFTILVFCFGSLLPLLCFGEKSFYDILGVPNDADTRTIRKAFKKIAIVKHPDKNQDDPNAHSVFVGINRAYEVLKDEELRKKYDEYGEAGLNDNFQPNQQYQSWQFYNENFGIYDEDVEIVTLSRADFKEEVTESNEFWFINFYSTFCSHCHALAPAWREFAKKMDGIVRIGAVNCAEDPMLCQSQRVQGYPSLVVYPKHEFYHSSRDVESLINFVVPRMTAPIYDLNSLHDVSSLKDHNTLPFLVEYCNEFSGCISQIEKKKLASKIKDIANFGVVNCASETGNKLCAQFLDHGFAFYPFNGYKKEHEKEIEFSDLRELYNKVLDQIEDIEQIDNKKLSELLRNDRVTVNEPIATIRQINSVVIFLDNLKNLKDYAEYKKLNLNIANAKIYFADFSSLDTKYKSRLQLNNLPKVVLFRANGGYDIHYSSKISVREVHKFLHKSLSSTLITLTDETYYGFVEDVSNDIYLIDYFAPWCPPCIRLIPELRKLPPTIDGRNLRVATLDCDAFKSICKSKNINSYPTGILHIKGVTFNTVGYHNSYEILDFIEDSLNPSLHILDYESFQELVVKRPRGRIFFVDFFAPWCGPCQQLAPEFRKLARLFRNNSDVISFATVDCDIQRALCTENGINSYPALRFFDAKQGFKPKEYPQQLWRNHKSMQLWLNEQLPSLVEKISGNFYTDVLSSATPILVDYYAPWCGHCIQFAPILETIAKLLEGEVRIAKVNCDVTPHICKTASVQAYPSLRLYINKHEKNPYGIQIRPEPNANTVTQMIREILDKKGIMRRDEL